MKDSTFATLVLSFVVLLGWATAWYVHTHYCSDRRFDYDSLRLCMSTRDCMTDPEDMRRLRKYETRCFRKPGVE